jgi:hypothetical protein
MHLQSPKLLWKVRSSKPHVTSSLTSNFRNSHPTSLIQVPFLYLFSLIFVVDLIIFSGNIGYQFG